VSGPLLDRIDMHIEVGRPPKDAMREKGPSGEPSAAVAQRIREARALQLERAPVCNARLEGDQLETDCELNSSCLTMLEVAVDKFNLSARAYQRVRRVARTIADLAGTGAIEPRHVAEALSFRQLDKRMNRG